MFWPAEGPEEGPPSEGADLRGEPLLSPVSLGWQCDPFLGGTSKRLLEGTWEARPLRGAMRRHHVPGPDSHL